MTRLLSLVFPVLFAGCWVTSGSASAQRSAQRSGSQASTITLSSAQVSASRTATITAPGPGAQLYTPYLLNLAGFGNGGKLTITIHLLPSSHTLGSFDLFPAGITLPTRGRPTGTLGGRYDVRPGATVQISFPFKGGQNYVLGLTGNWSSPKGATGQVSVTVAAAGQATTGSGATDGASRQGSSTAEVIIHPIAYGPHVQEGGKATGVCIYLGARVLGKPPSWAQSASDPKAPIYNWVQRVSASDKVTDQNCAHDADGTFIDNCPVGPTTPKDLSYAPNSDFYRNGNAAHFTGAENPTWIDPNDGRPYDYIFVDIPSRPTAKFKPGDPGLNWRASLQPVREGADCTAGHAVTNHGEAVLPYCTLTPQTNIEYGFTLKRIERPILARIVEGQYYVLHLDSLRIGGNKVANGGDYIVQVNNGSYTLSQEWWSMLLLPKTAETAHKTVDICSHSYFLQVTNNKNKPLPEEPSEFKGSFNQFPASPPPSR